MKWTCAAGRVLGKILIYSFPLMLSGILQLLFNAADVIVVGRYAGSQSLAAVGSTGALINLLINVFIGLSVGVNVLVAQYYGAKRDQDVNETVHTAVAISLLSGVFLVALGLLVTRPLLELMGTPDDVIDKSAIYMKIYFAGMPATMLYNFGSAVLRAVGDTRRPLYFLTAAGVVNVVLNLFFVISLNMDVAGVALATVISQVISAGLVFWCLVKSEGALKLRIRDLRISKVKLKRIAKIGLPAGMQGAVFSISNVLIQSSVNSFGSIAMAGNTASQNIEGFIYNAMNAIYQTNLSFTSQNYGGRKYKRIGRITLTCVGVVTAVGLGMGLAAFAAGESLLRIYSSDPEVIQFGLKRMAVFGAHILPLRHHGYHGGQYPGPGKLRDPHVRIHYRCLRPESPLDLHGFPVEPEPDDPVPFLSSDLGGDRGAQHRLLPDAEKEASQRGWRVKNTFFSQISPLPAAAGGIIISMIVN